MRKIIITVIVTLLIVIGVFIGAKIVNKCDDCETWFLGTGYEANIISDVVSDEDQTICKACAEKQHIIETTLGKSLEEFKKGFFE